MPESIHASSSSYGGRNVWLVLQLALAVDVLIRDSLDEFHILGTQLLSQCLIESMILSDSHASLVSTRPLPVVAPTAVLRLETVGIGSCHQYVLVIFQW